MTKEVSVLTIQFLDVKFHPADIPKLRGYLARRFSEYPLLHNHLPGGKFSYRFPQIQYRVIDWHPAVWGIGEGIELLMKIFPQITQLKIGETTSTTHEQAVSLQTYHLGMIDHAQTYRFLSPWLALKHINYQKYLNLDDFERQSFLRHILRENLKTISKGVDYTIPNIDAVQVEGYFQSQFVRLKGQKMMGFMGDFMINFEIPAYFAVGKQGARGFGVIDRA